MSGNDSLSDCSPSRRRHNNHNQRLCYPSTNLLGDGTLLIANNYRYRYVWRHQRLSIGRELNSVRSPPSIIILHLSSISKSWIQVITTIVQTLDSLLMLNLHEFISFDRWVCLSIAIDFFSFDSLHMSTRLCGCVVRILQSSHKSKSVHSRQWYRFPWIGSIPHPSQT
jgi:hypothetical protein